jgi:hypothetical protein
MLASKRARLLQVMAMFAVENGMYDCFGLPLELWAPSNHWIFEMTSAC